MRNITKGIIGAVAAGALVLSGASVANAGPGGKMTCVVSEPISAAALNAGGTWSFELFNGQPDLRYNVQVTWSGDPSNGGHPNAGVATDATGYGYTELPAYWAADAFLPGTFDANNVYTAVPGQFEVRVGPKAYNAASDAIRAGKTTCVGVVTE